MHYATKAKKMRISINGKLQKGLHQKMLHYLLFQNSHIWSHRLLVEYAGKVFEDMSMEEEWQFAT